MTVIAVQTLDTGIQSVRLYKTMNSGSPPILYVWIRIFVVQEYSSAIGVFCVCILTNSGVFLKGTSLGGGDECLVLGTKKHDFRGVCTLNNIASLAAGAHAILQLWVQLLAVLGCSYYLCLPDSILVGRGRGS